MDGLADSMTTSLRGTLKNPHGNRARRIRRRRYVYVCAYAGLWLSLPAALALLGFDLLVATMVSDG